ncbi:MAG: hypothetical protein KJ672_04685, partial [Candidatus Thermoplasmatota archaeon]|nr:hypothetical protein [Candidatus Thermoplasmatota archaeon]
LGFGAFVAESLGLAIIVITGSDEAPGWILYFAAVLVALAVVMMIAFFLSAMLSRRLNKGRADRS